jgi:hypothetical protein
VRKSELTMLGKMCAALKDPSPTVVNGSAGLSSSAASRRVRCLLLLLCWAGSTQNSLPSGSAMTV